MLQPIPIWASKGPLASGMVTVSESAVPSTLVIGASLDAPLDTWTQCVRSEKHGLFWMMALAWRPLPLGFITLPLTRIRTKFVLRTANPPVNDEG